MKTGWIWTALALAILSTGFAQQRAPISAPCRTLPVSTTSAALSFISSAAWTKPARSMLRL